MVDDSFQSFLDYIRIQKEAFWLTNCHMAEDERQSRWQERLTSIMSLTEMPSTNQQSLPCKRRPDSTSLHSRASKRPMHDDSVPHAVNLYRNASEPSTLVMHVEDVDPQAPHMTRVQTDGAVYKSRHAPQAQKITYASALDNVRNYSVDEYVAMHTIAEEPRLADTLPFASDFSVDISDSTQQSSSSYMSYGFEQQYQTHIDSPSIDASPSTMISEPMSRSNTNDMICSPMGMLRLRSNDPKKAPIDSQIHDVSFFSPSAFPSTNTLSPQFTHVFAPQLPVFSTYPSFETSSPFSQSCSPLSSVSPSNKSRALRRTEEQIAHAARPIAPKSTDVVNPLLAPTLMRVPLANGGVKEVAQIPKSNYSRPSKQKTFCPHCNDQPEGFHGDHELRRHVDRIHATKRKVWICKEAQPGGTFLANCKACRHKKTYGANYNAAAHLRRTHFHPCKKGRGGRGKPSEKRGGKGGGDHPSMAELKDWMYETEEIVPLDQMNDTVQSDDELALESPYADQVVTEEMATNGSSQTSEASADDDFDSSTLNMFDQIASSEMPPSSYLLAPSGTNKTYNSRVSCSIEAKSIPRQPIMEMISAEPIIDSGFSTTMDMQYLSNLMFDPLPYNSYGGYHYPGELDVEVGGSA